MWFLGLVLGAIIGAVGGMSGAVLGALFGAFVGWLMAQERKSSLQTDRIQGLETSVRLLQERVAVLETALNARGAVGAPEPIPEKPIFVEPVFIEPEPVTRVEESFEPLAAPSDFFTPSEELPAGAPASETEVSSERPLPAAATRAPSALWNFFFGGNTLVRFGVIVLFFGVSFLLKYASEHIEIPVEARLIGVALGALAMLAIGWRLRRARPGYALTVQGGGVGLLYLTVFAAFRLYQLLPAGLVFTLLVAMAVFSAMLAVLQDSRSLAAMGVSGGFLAPILASTGAGSHVALFSFYALLNGGILIIAWFKAWRSLNLLGFAFTFVIGLSWGARFYRPELFASTEPFLILFFLFYVTIAILFALRQEASIKNPVDGTLVFGAPMIAFGLQSVLVRDSAYGAAYSALVLSGFYLILAKLFFARLSAEVRLLLEAFLALGVVFGTLAIPLAFDGRWTAAAWALEGAAIVWVGVRQNKIAARGFGIFLQFAAGAAFALDAGRSGALTPLLNSLYLGCVFISVAGLFSAWYLQRHRARLKEGESLAAVLLFCWGVLWWFGGGFNEIGEHVNRTYRLHTFLSFAVVSCAAFSLLHFRIGWPEAKYVALALLPLMIVFALLEVDQVAHPFEYFGFVVWPLAFAAHVWLLHRHETAVAQIRWWHAAGVWLFAALASWETAWWIGESIDGGEAWRVIGWPLLPIALLAWLAGCKENSGWPLSVHLRVYLIEAAVPLAGFLWLWMLHANFTSRGDAAPIPYLPLINPLDLTQFASLMALFSWSRRLRAEAWAPPLLRSWEIASVSLGSAAFLWLNGALLRSLHQWAGVPFEFKAMMRSMLVQSSLSIFWSLLALCLMLSATRMRLRPLWLTGAVLMGLVVVKLFFVDLSNVGGIERIVSFIGVGLLMLLIGYVSPVPPALVQEKR